MKLTVVALGVALVLTACGGPAGPSASSTTTALIHTKSIKVGDKTQTVLKNSKGLTLYYLTSDSSTSITCTGGCATTWPALIATTDNPTSDPALPGQLSVLNGPNGKQVLYSGHPLYTYAKDGAEGDAYGQGIGGVWFVATPDLAKAGASSAPSRYVY